MEPFNLVQVPGGLLRRFYLDNEALVVLMGETRLVDFRQTPVIGTYGLGACNVALVVSDRGAILAHIPPTTSINAAPGEGPLNLRRMMDEVRAEYDGHRDLFPVANTYVVCAWFEQHGVPMQDHVDMIKDCFQAMGVTTATFHYPAPPTAEVYDGQGTVVVASGRIFVEDRLVADAADHAHQGRTAAAAPSRTQSHPGYATPRYGTPAYGTAASGTPAYGAPAYGTSAYTTPGFPNPGSVNPGYTNPGYATPMYPTDQGRTATLYSGWSQDGASTSTAQTPTTTLGSNLTAQGSTMTPITAQESTTTMDSSLAPSTHSGEARRPAMTATAGWVKVVVDVQKRTLARTHFVFDGQNGKVTTNRDSWKAVTLQGGGKVWTYRGRRTGITYYTAQDIGNA